ncbi:MAG TPA: alpha/beta fold hydrolase [Myxococcales bacterium]|nr:alpha/beta fold hydrolase [Myxococcales bacterium]
MTGKFSGDLTGLVADAVENTLAFNPLIGLRPRDAAAAALALVRALAGSPREAAALFRAYLKEIGDVVRGDSRILPDAKDRRFGDPAWQSNPFCKRLMQAHGVTQKALSQLVERSSLDKRDKARAQFFLSLAADALAPSNWPFVNPVMLRKLVDTGGWSLVAGIRNLVADVRENHALPSQVDKTPFRVGGNVAVTPGQVVHRSEMFELIQYAPSGPRVHARPLVMSPPQVNKYYAVDLAPEKSLLKWAVDSGVQMFVVSWRNPTAEQGHWGLEDYAMALDEAVDVARDITGSPDVNMWGSCSGGMTLAAYLGWLAARGERKVAHTSWAVCVLDTEAAMADTTLGLFSTPAAIRTAKARSRRLGMITGPEMARTFAWMRANDLIWNYWVSNYLLGNKPPAFDILFWNNDTTRLPGQFHCDLLDLFEKNPYLEAGAMKIGGLPVDLRQVKVGAYVIGGVTDHITPWRACYRTARLFGPQATFVLANAGHLQSLINPPGAGKSFFMAAPATPEDPDEWARRAQAGKVDGSWWPHWRQWIAERSGDLVEAPKALGSAAHPPLCPAPGTYVHQI